MLNSYYSVIFADYTTYLESTEYQLAQRALQRSAMILWIISTDKTLQTGEIIMENCNAYLKNSYWI